MNSFLTIQKSLSAIRMLSSYLSRWAIGFGWLSLLACQAPSNTHYSLRPLEDITPEIPQYEEPVIKQATWQNLSESKEMRYQPKVDIVFLIDNSTSMRPVQENLSRNIDQFVSSLNSLKALDYQIGVMTNWDDYTSTFQAAHREGPGALRVIPGLERRFFTKNDERLSSRLGQALKVGVMDVKDGGPEHESFLTPLVGMLERTGRGAPNEGFLREDAYLAVIVITDADDMSQNLTPEQVARALVAFKGDARKVMVYGVLTRAEDRDDQKDPGLRKTPRYHPECFVQFGNSWKDNGLCPKAFGPSRLESLLLHANAYLGNKQSIWSRRWFHIHSRDFGRNLTRVSEDIVVSSSHKEWILPSRPTVDAEKGEIQVRVKYRSGDQVLPVPFDYLAESNKVMVRSLPPSVRSLPAGEFIIEWLPVVDE